MSPAKRARRAASVTTPQLPAPAAAINAVAVLALFVPGVLSFGPVFGGAEGYIAAGGGVVLGVALGWLARRFRWPLATVVAATVVVYLLFGGALALSRTTLFGVIPTVDTLVRLVPLSVQAWRDLLTVSLPASNFVGPAVVPYLSGLVLALVATLLALRPHGYRGALVPPLLMLLLGILWGIDVAPWGAALGVGYGVLALSWAAWRRIDDFRNDGQAILVSPGSDRLARRRLGGATGMIAAAAAFSLAVSPLMMTANRHVLRQDIRPPLRLQDYASPLTLYRYLELDQRKVGLFTVSGLPSGARVRLASLDAYDGRVYTVDDASSSFVRTGEQAMGSAPDGATTIGITVSTYTGVWMPGGGDVRGVTFTGPNAQAQRETLYYNAFGGTLLTTTPLRGGDGYSVQLTEHAQPAELPDQAALASVALPELSGVPELIGETATEYIGDANTPMEQLRAIEQRLQQGFYSDGADGLSAAGHSSARIASMLSATQLIGDDEQYAVAMALMARQLGIPCRVVMGFYPATAAKGTVEVTGEMAHVWVEVPFQGLGWVQFDPTPDRTRRPQTTEPKPKPTPRPQVLPPPEPPLDRVDVPLEDPGKKRNEDDDASDLLMRILITVGIGLGIAALVSAPFLIIVGLKHRRRTLRMTDPRPANRISGAWAELTDVAIDLGSTVPPIATRRQTGAQFDQEYPAAEPGDIAMAVDANVFGNAEPTVEAATHVWTHVDQAVGVMKSSKGRWRRVTSTFSLRSLRAARASANRPSRLHRMRRKGPR